MRIFFRKFQNYIRQLNLKLSISESNYFIEHDPGRWSDITYLSQRQCLLSLSPLQPKLVKYTINSDIDPLKQKSFSPIWFEYPIIQYSSVIVSTFCFVCVHYF